MKIISPGPSTALAVAALAVAILKSEAAEGDKKPVRKRLNGPKSTTITDHRDLMSMPAIEGIVQGIPGQPAPAFSPDVLERICPKPDPPPTPVANFGTWKPFTYSMNSTYFWQPDIEIETDWFIDTDCGPRNQCYQAGDSQDDYQDPDECGEEEEVPVVDTDVEVRGGIKKKTPEHHDGIEAIDHKQYTVLENKFNFEEQGVLTFDMFCSSELGRDTCKVWLRKEGLSYAEVLKESGNKGWMSKAIAVPKGAVYVAWEYEKNSSCSNHDDTMKLDNIKFLQYALSASIEVADENLVIPSEGEKGV